MFWSKKTCEASKKFYSYKQNLNKFSYRGTDLETAIISMYSFTNI